MQVHFNYPDGTSDTVEAPDKATAAAMAQQKVNAWAAGRSGGRNDDALGPVLEGITGGWLDEASGGVGALISAMGGGTLEEGYRRGFEGSKGRREGFAKRNPKTSTALELAGGVGSFALLPEVKAAQALGGAARLGRVGARLTDAAATGAAYGGAAGAGYAESPEGLDSRPIDVAASTVGGALTGAGLGAGLGAGGEAVLGGAAAAGRGLRRAVMGDVTRADVERTVGRNVRREHGGTVDDLVNEMRGLQGEGYDVRIGDMGGVRTRRMARAAADISPEAQQTLEGVTRPRFESQSGRTQAAIERESGGVGEETRFGMGDRIRAAERERGALYNEAYQRGDEGIPWSPELADLAHDDPTFREVMRTAAQRLQQNNHAARARGGRQWDLYGREPRPARGIGDNSGSGSGPRGTLAYWDQVKRELDRRINVAGTNEGGRQTEEARALDMMRRTLVEHLDSHVPAYAHARGRAHDLFGGRDALQIGEHAFDTGMTGTEIRRVQAELTPSERRLFQMAWISKMQTHVRQMGDTTDIGKKIAASDHARDQLVAVFGRDRAENLIRHRDIERRLNLLDMEVRGNSKSVRYAIGALGGAGIGALSSGGNLFDTRTWIGAGLGAAAALGFGRTRAALSGMINERAAQWVAHALTSRDPELLRRIASMGQRDPQIREAISRLGRVGAGVGTMGTEQAMH